MDATLTVKFSQLKSLVSQIDINKKIELIKILEEDTFPVRFKNFLKKIETNEIDMDDITREVELVRKKRYDAQKND